MRGRQLLLLVSALLLAPACSPALRVGTYNIQYDEKSSDIASWDSRREIVRDLLDNVRFDVFGAQEPMTYQVEDILDMCPRYRRVGESTDSTANPSLRHHNPIFYLPERLDLLENGSFWYSDNPSVRWQKGWDAGYVRMCNWAKFRDRKTGKVFCVFNSHFDHIGKEAPVLSAGLLLEKVAEIASGMPSLCMGDYNSDQFSETYSILADSDNLSDSYSLAMSKANDSLPSFQNYHMPPPSENPSRIDHIFVTKGIRVLSWELVTFSRSGRFGSDHFPVSIDIRLRRQN